MTPPTQPEVPLPDLSVLWSSVERAEIRALLTSHSEAVATARTQAMREALENYLTAQDAFDNCELMGPNAELPSVLMRRRKVARLELDATLANTGGKAV